MRQNLLILTLILAAVSLVAANNAQAHQPRYIQDNQLVLIKNPAVSQAFYGELKEWPAYYLIDLKKAQELYFQILVPDLPKIQKDKSVTVEYLAELGKPAAAFAALDPGSVAWKGFYEEYAGDNYLEGPEVKKTGEAGYYIIKISNPDNAGKYVLVVGEKEEFPPREIAKALITIPQLKVKFFDKPLWQSFQGKIGKYLGFGLAALIIIGYLFYKFHRIYK
jgi:hypothetical protein